MRFITGYETANYSLIWLISPGHYKFRKEILLSTMTELEATSVFYTLSTVAQVLAAFIAISSVFVFYKVNEDRSEMKLLAFASIGALKSMELYNSLIEDYVYRLQKDYENGSINGVIMTLDSMVEKYLVSSQDQTKIGATAMLHRDLIVLVQSKINRLLRYTKKSIFLGIIAIFICITTLSLIPLIPYLILIFIMILVIILAVLSLSMMVWVIFYSITNTKTGYPV